MSEEKPLDPEAARIVAKVRRLLVIVSATTFIAVAAVLGVIGYRVFNWEGRAPASSFADVTQALPAGAKVISTAISDNHILVTVEIGGMTELHTFDPDTLQPLGRLRLETKR